MKTAAKSPAIIGITGGSGSGKTELARRLLKRLGKHAALVSQDWYYHDRSTLSPEEKRKLNFDHPRSFDAALLMRHLRELKRWRPVQTPRYDYASHRRFEQAVPLPSADIILLEGLVILNDARLR